jgi:hypothetical protein
LATGLGITLAALAAGFASGWLVVRSGGGGGGKPSLSDNQPPATPNAVVPPSSFPSTTNLTPQANAPQADLASSSPRPAPSKNQTDFERLVATDTEASLREAIGRLEALTTRTSAEEELLTRAKARLAQIQLRGVR